MFSYQKEHFLLITKKLTKKRISRMKKIFTLLLFIFTTFAANAQVEFIHNGKVVEEGATIEFKAEVLDFGGGFTMVTCEPNEPFVKNTGSSTASVTVKVEKTDPDNDQLTWCGITSSCMPIKGASESRRCTLGAGEQSALALHGTFTDGVYATYTAKVTASVSGSERTIYIKFVYDDEANIESTVADMVKVNGNTIHYNFASNGNRTLNVYGVSGRLMKSVKIGQNGTLSLQGLQRGAYIYEVKLNGQRQQAHKFILR
jgi:hypothetical protein